MSAMASQITSASIGCSTGCSGADRIKHQSSASLAFVREIQPVTGGFPPQRANNAENVSTWLRRHAYHDNLSLNLRNYIWVFLYPKATCSITQWSLYLLMTLYRSLFGRQQLQWRTMYDPIHIRHNIFHTLRPRQFGRRFVGKILRCISWINFWITIWKFHWISFLRVAFTISQHWLRW